VLLVCSNTISVASSGRCFQSPFVSPVRSGCVLHCLLWWYGVVCDRQLYKFYNYKQAFLSSSKVTSLVSTA
jgi:hypothetical protein